MKRIENMKGLEPFGIIPLSRTLYDQKIAEWLANGRRVSSQILLEPDQRLSVVALCAACLQFAQRLVQFRGRIYIYASLGRWSPEEEADDAMEVGYEIEDLRRGVMVGTVEITDCTNEGHGDFASGQSCTATYSRCAGRATAAHLVLSIWSPVIGSCA
jgi:hypothetical protein